MGKRKQWIAVTALCFICVLGFMVWNTGQVFGAAGTGISISSKHMYSYAYDVLKLVNQERNRAGLSSLKMDKDLTEAAMQRASEIVVSFSHTRPDGSACFTVSDKVYGENCAAGQYTPKGVVNAWMNSQGHRANILNSSYKTIGIGVVEVDGMYYWIQSFGYDSLNPAAAKAPKDETKQRKVKLSKKNTNYSFSLSLNKKTIQQGQEAKAKVYVNNGFTTVALAAKNVRFSTSKTSVAKSSGATITGCKAGTVKVKAELRDNSGIFLTTKLKVTKGILAPKLTKISNNKNGVKLQWDKSYGAAEYRIYRKKGSGKYKELAKLSAKKTNYTDKSVKNQSTYTYKVKAYNKAGSGKSGNTKTICYIKVPSGVKTQNTNAGLQISYSRGGKMDGCQVKYVSLANSETTYTYTWESLNSSKVELVLSNVTNKKNFRIQIRNYIKIGKKTYYSPWKNL